MRSDQLMKFLFVIFCIISIVFITSFFYHNSNMKFDSQKWPIKNDIDYSYRKRMISDLIESDLLNNKTYKDVIEIIGKPDYADRENNYFYNIIVKYGNDIDPIYLKSLVVSFNSDSVIDTFFVYEYNSKKEISRISEEKSIKKTPILFQYPPQSGTYEKDGWKYILNIKLRGARSEKRDSKLFYGDKEVIGHHGDTISCPLGKFMFFGDKSSLGIYGWHNQGKFDKPIIDLNGYFKKDILKEVLFHRREADSLVQ